MQTSMFKIHSLWKPTAMLRAKFRWKRKAAMHGWENEIGSDLVGTREEENTTKNNQAENQTEPNQNNPLNKNNINKENKTNRKQNKTKQQKQQKYTQKIHSKSPKQNNLETKGVCTRRE